MDKNLVITISRRYGCGGRELAGYLADKLAINLYDRQLVHIAAAKLKINDLPEEDLLELENTVKPLSSMFIPFHSFGVNLGSGEYSRGLFLEESAVIRRIAEQKSCIILGRCADYILRENENKFSIFVTADDDFRENRGKITYSGRTLKEMNFEDKKRARYYEYYTDQTWGDPANYDLVVNVSKEPLKKIADGIISYIESVKK